MESTGTTSTARSVGSLACCLTLAPRSERGRFTWGSRCCRGSAPTYLAEHARMPDPAGIENIVQQGLLSLVLPVPAPPGPARLAGDRWRRGPRARGPVQVVRVRAPPTAGHLPTSQRSTVGPQNTERIRNASNRILNSRYSEFKA